VWVERERWSDPKTLRHSIYRPDREKWATHINESCWASAILTQAGLIRCPPLKMACILGGGLLNRPASINRF